MLNSTLFGTFLDLITTKFPCWELVNLILFYLQDGNAKSSVWTVEEDQMKSCSEGKHDLVIWEDLGEVCICCGHVEREMKYILPDFVSTIF